MPSECLKEGHCKALQTSFFECKRSMVSQLVGSGRVKNTGNVLSSSFCCLQVVFSQSDQKHRNVIENECLIFFKLNPILFYKDNLTRVLNCAAD